MASRHPGYFCCPYQFGKHCSRVHWVPLLKDHLQYARHNVDAYHAGNQAEVLGDDSGVRRGGLFLFYEQVEVAPYLFDIFKRLLDIELLVEFGAPFQEVWFDLFPRHFAQLHVDSHNQCDDPQRQTVRRVTVRVP
jgi:hypothetical protein